MPFRPIAIIAAVVGLLGGTISVGASSEHFNPPKHYYLALGDSLAYGYQDAKFKAELATGTFDASTFTGYAGDFAAAMKVVRPDLQETNLGCPGETTLTYFHAGTCPTPSILLHVHYTTSQRDAALAFLAAHPGQVSPITLDNGANDVTPCLQLPDPTACFATSIAGVGANLDTALAELRAAAPDAEIIVMQYYDPFALALPSSLPVTQLLNQTIAAQAAKHGARLADAFTPFNVSPPPPDNLCTLTLICPPTFDEHASDRGYALIAQQFWAASGYSRLGD
jgi:lysophospholipase L1-like esterase